MKIVLYRFTYRKTDVVKNLNNSVEYTCTLRFPTNILDPVVRIQLDENVTNIPNWSYAYIEEFGQRYYFVQNIIAFSNRVFDLYLHVDVLYTYIGKQNSLFRNLDVYVERNDVTYNSMIQDKRLQFLYENEIIYERPSNDVVNDFGLTSIAFKILENPSVDDNNFNILISVTTKTNASYSSPTTINPSCSDTAQVKGQFSTMTLGCKTYILNKSQAVAVLNELIVDDQKASYIRAIRILPYCLRSAVRTEDNNNGTITYGNNASFTISTSYPIYTVSGYEEYHFFHKDFSSEIISEFYNNEGYEKFELYIPYYGWYQLDKNILKIRPYISITYIMNYDTLDSAVHVYCNSTSTFGGSLIMSERITLGVEVAINTSNSYENERKKTAISSNAVLSTLCSVGAIVAGGIMTANGGTGIPLIVGGATGLASGLGNAVAQGLQIYDYGSKNLSQNNDALLLYDYIMIKRIRNLHVGYSQAFLNENGRPSCIGNTMRNLRGYVELGKCEFAVGNTQEEKELEELTMGGVHFPTTAW